MDMPRELFADYGIVGYATEFEVWVTAAEQSELSVGDEITIVGDGVADRQATVTKIGDGWVSVRLHRSHVKDQSSTPEARTFA